MKSATRMALVTGEMSDCMSRAGAGQSGVELRVCPFRPSFCPSVPLVRRQSVRRRSPPPLLAAAPVATVEDGAGGFAARGHTHRGS